MSMSREELLGALARGYCTAENSGKELDAPLINAMADEVEAALAALQLAALQPDAIREKAVRECAAVCGGLEDYGSDERQAALDDCEAAILKLLERKP